MAAQCGFLASRVYSEQTTASTTAPLLFAMPPTVLTSFSSFAKLAKTLKSTDLSTTSSQVSDGRDPWSSWSAVDACLMLIYKKLAIAFLHTKLLSGKPFPRHIGHFQLCPYTVLDTSFLFFSRLADPVVDVRMNFPTRILWRAVVFELDTPATI